MPSAFGVQTGGGGFATGGGGGPDASFVSNSPRLSQAPKVASPSPYSDVGKFNVNVMSPQAFTHSMQQNVENTGLIHGMTQAVFGENTGSYLGGVPGLGLAGRVFGNVADTAAGIGGNILGAVGSLPNPFSAGYAHLQFMQSQDTPEKRAATAGEWNPFAILQKESDYLASLRKNNPPTPYTGPLALNPEVEHSKDPTVGGLVSSIFDVLHYTALGVERTIAGGPGPTGDRLDSLEREDPANLGPIEMEALQRYKAGEWSKDRALDYLVANNAGLSNNPAFNIVFSALLDPLTWGSFGAAGVAKGGRVLKDIEAIQMAASRELSLAQKAGDVDRIAAAQQAVENAARMSETMPDTGRWTRFLARTVGKYAWPVMKDPTLGPIARVAHNVIDPTRLLFSESDPAQRILKSRLSLESTMAVTHAYGQGNVYRVFNALDKFHPDLTARVQQSMGEYVGGLERAWASREVGRDMLNRMPEGSLGSPIEYQEARLAALPKDISVHLEQFAREVTPLEVTPQEIAQRMASAYGGKAEDYRQLVTSLNQDGLAYLHAATTAAARSDLLVAIGKQSTAGTWKMPASIDKVILIGPGELTTQRASRLMKELNKLKGPDKVAKAQAAVEQYDILRYSQNVTSEDSVAEIVTYIKNLIDQGVLAGEMTPKQLSTLQGEVGDWLAKYGQTVDGKPLYGLGFRPEDDKLWRLVTDPQTEKVIGMAPWTDYVSESAPGFRPGFSRALPGAPGVVQKAADWMAIGKQNLFHEISTARVALEAKRRFFQTAMQDLGMTESEARVVHGALQEHAANLETSVRGISAADMWRVTGEAGVIPYRLTVGPNAITRRRLVDAVLSAYTNKLDVVGGTQFFTGKLKEDIDKIPGMGWAGGNVAGQISERLWPSLKFKYNPFFQAQESGEGQFFSALRGVPAYMKGPVNESDELAFKVWGTFDHNLESIGDQIENSVSVLTGHIQGTLESASGIKRIKYVNAARQFRNTLGEIGRRDMSAEFMNEIKAHYNTLNDGEAMLRWLDEQQTAGRDVIRQLGLGSRNAYEDIIKAADWSKPIEQGAVAPLHVDTLARRMGFKDESTLVSAIRSRTNSLTKSDVHQRLIEMEAHPEYINRVMNALDFRGVDSWMKAAAKAFNMTERDVNAWKSYFSATARIRGMSTSEYMSQVFHNKIGVFSDPANLPVTDAKYLRQVRAGLRDKGKVQYKLDDPEVQQVLTRAREMRGQTEVPPATMAKQQRAHDRVNANPAAYAPGPLREHVTPTGRKTYTGDLGWDQIKDDMERHVGLRDGDGILQSPEGILDAANWYNELPGFVLSMMDGDTENAAKVLLGFLYTQKATSPVQGMRLILKASDRYNIATEVGMEKFFTEDLQLSKDVIRKVFLGEPIESGLGVKLFDFTDAGLLMPKRFVGDWAPTPSDRWMVRARGFMDEDGLQGFQRAYGYRTAADAGYLDPALYRVDGKLDSAAYDAALAKTGLERVYPSISDDMYEETTRWTNEMAKAANAEGWLGKTDWTGSQMQAAIWVGAQKAVDAYPEAGADMLFHNATQMALEVRPSERGPFHALLADWDQLDDIGKGALTDEMASQVSAVFNQRLGIPVNTYFTGVWGSWEGTLAPNFTIEIAGTGETIDRAVLSGLASLGQDYGIAVREMPSVFTRSNHDTGLYHAIDFLLPMPAREADDLTHAIANLPTMKNTGFMPFAGADGNIRLRSVMMTDKNTSTAAVNQTIAQLQTELAEAGIEGVGLEMKGVHVVQHGQDWVADPRGLTIRERLRGLGATGEYAERQLFGHVGTEGITQPILGEFRTLTDDFIRDHLEGRAFRGRSSVGDLPEAPEGMLLNPGDIVPGSWVDSPYNVDLAAVELVPLGTLKTMGFYTPRSPANAARYDALLDSMKSRGVDEPIVLEYSEADRAIRVKDGSLRIGVAQDAGLDYLPTRVEVVPHAFPDDEFQSATPLYPTNLTTPMDERGLDLFPDHAPSDLDIPVERGFVDDRAYGPWGYSHAESKAMTAEAAHMMGVQRGAFERFGVDTAGVHATRRYLQAVYDSRGGQVPLYSGARPGSLQKVPRVGDTVTFPLRSTSPTKAMAENFAWGSDFNRSILGDADYRRGFIYRFPRGTKGVVHAGPENEVVVSGKFHIDGISRVRAEDFLDGVPSEGEFITIVDVHQTEVFNPETTGWERVREQPLRVRTSRGVTPDQGAAIQAAYDSGDVALGQRLQREAMDAPNAIAGFGVPPDLLTDGTEPLKYANEFVTRGAMSMAKDGRSILWASKDAADPLTFAHEMAHAMHTHMDPSMESRLMAEFRKDTGSKARKWNRNVSEWFADSYIRALRQGLQSADPELQRAFNYFAKWSDKAIKGGLLKGENKGFAARGALTPEEYASLSKPMRAESQALLEEMTSPPAPEALPFNKTEEMTWNAMTDAAKEAGYDAFRVNFFKKNRTLLERSVNHPMFGLYPASYMWGKVLPEMVRFIAKDPFGMPGGHVAWASADIWRSIQQQSAIDPEFAKTVDALGKNGAIRLLGLMLPGTPWELPVNAPAWARRLAQAGLENEAAAKAGKKLTPNNPIKIWQDTMQYQFGSIPNAFSAVGQLVTGSEDLYSTISGEPTTGKNAPSIGAGLSSLNQTINALGEPVGEGLPSVTDIFSGDDGGLNDILDQNDELQSELYDAQSQLEAIFERYPFTQQ